MPIKWQTITLPKRRGQVAHGDAPGTVWWQRESTWAARVYMVLFCGREQVGRLNRLRIGYFESFQQAVDKGTVSSCLLAGPGVIRTSGYWSRVWDGKERRSLGWSLWTGWSEFEKWTHRQIVYWVSGSWSRLLTSEHSSNSRPSWLYALQKITTTDPSSSWSTCCSNIIPHTTGVVHHLHLPWDRGTVMWHWAQQVHFCPSPLNSPCGSR